MNKRLIHTAILSLLLLAGSARADIVVVVHKNNEIPPLSRTELIDLYMGRYITFPNNISAELIDQGKDTKIRKQFYQQLVGKSVAEVNAFWARLLFTGRAKPPKVVQDSEQIVTTLAENVNAIAYIDEREADESLKVVFRFASF